MVRAANLISIVDLAAEIGVRRHTVGEIVKLHAIPTQPMQHGGAKGLDPVAVERIKNVLNIKRVPATA